MEGRNIKKNILSKRTGPDVLNWWENKKLDYFLTMSQNVPWKLRKLNMQKCTLIVAFGGLSETKYNRISIIVLK